MGSQKYRDRYTTQDWAKMATTVVALASTLFYFTINVFDQQKARRESEITAMESRTISEEIQRQKGVLDEAQARNLELLKQLTKGVKAVPEGSRSRQEMALVKKDLSDIHGEVSNLRSSLDNLGTAITGTPEKAVTIPLLKKDVDDLRLSTQRDIDSLRGEMARSYDLNKWLIGLILAAVLGMLVNSILQSRNQRHERQPRFE